MGQYWMFVNIDRCQSTGSWGKMGEWFFDGSTNIIMYLLAVPARPLESRWRGSPLSNPSVSPGSWAGDRIMCLGDYAEEWPEGKVAPEDFAPESDIRTPEDFMENCTRIETNTFRYDWDLNKLYPQSRVWVLRNLTKKIYIRSNGIPTANKDGILTYDEHGGFTGLPGLSNVLTSRIAWSNDSSISMAYEDAEGIVSGRWAADRLDVRLFDDVEQELIHEGWADETRVEARRQYDMWMSDHNYAEEDFDFPEEPGMVDVAAPESESK